MKKLLTITLLGLSLFALPTVLSAQCSGGNPSTDFTAWNYSLSIEENFNAARRWEEGNKGLTPNCLGDMAAPTGGWGALSNAQIALYIHNSERTARGRLPFYGVETHLNTVSQNHSSWQIANDVFDHVGDPALGTGGNYYACPSGALTPGSTTTQRINSSSSLSGCWQGFGENISLNFSATHLVAVSIYGFMYEDGSCCGWGHRNNVLVNYSDDWGSTGTEGFIGVGVASGLNYTMDYWFCSFSGEAHLLTIDYYNPSPNPACDEFTFSATHATLPAPAALPAELSHFAATPRQDHVLLNWTTDTESQVDYFDIERSSDGRQFTAIGQHTAAGNTQTQQRYQWPDRHPLVGTSYYRLRTVDADGTAEYSPIRQVAFGEAQPWRLFPNPAKDVVTLAAAVPVADIANVTLTDARGVVFRPTWHTRSDQTLELDVAALPSGIYFLSVSTSTQVWTERLVKQ